MNKLLHLILVALLGACGSMAFAQGVAPVLKSHSGGLGTSTGDISGLTVTPAGGGARALANIIGDVANVWSQAVRAYADGQQAAAAVTATAGSPVVTVAGAAFSATDVGKIFAATGLGATLTTGAIASVPVTSGGAYAGLPTIAAAGGGVNAVLYPWMQLLSASLASGGAGCANGAQTFTLVGAELDDGASGATVTGTVTGGVLTGALAIAGVGNYSLGVPPASGAILYNSACTIQPTANVTYKLGGVRVSGGGLLWPVAGTSASISGGSPTTAATLGSPVVTPTAQILTTTILSVQSATQVTLAANVLTSQAGTTQTVFYGHDDYPAISAAMATGKPTFVPNVNGAVTTYWLSQPLTINTNDILVGADRDLVKVEAMPGANGVMATYNFASLIAAPVTAGVYNFRLENLTLDGNAANQICANPDLYCNTLAIFGSDYTLSNVKLINAAGNGLRTSWWSNSGGSTGANGLEANISQAWIENSQHHGWWNTGPHDCSVRDLIIISSSLGGDAVWDGFYGDGGACRFSNIHLYSGGGIQNFPRYQFSSNGSNQVSNSQFEGGRQQWESRSSYDLVANSAFYNNYGAYGVALIDLHGNSNIIRDAQISAMSNGAANYAVNFGTATQSVSANQVSFNAQSFGLLGNLNFTGDGGNSIAQNGAATQDGTNNATGLYPWGGAIGPSTVTGCQAGRCAARFNSEVDADAPGSGNAWLGLSRGNFPRFRLFIDSADNLDWVNFTNSGGYAAAFLSFNRASYLLSLGAAGPIGQYSGSGVLGLGAYADASKARATLTGAAYTIPNNTSWLAGVQTGVLASQTITFPTPIYDGHLLRISTVGAITALTLTPPSGATILGAPTSMAANSSVQFGWDAASSQWLRLQ